MSKSKETEGFAILWKLDANAALRGRRKVILDLLMRLALFDHTQHAVHVG